MTDTHDNAELDAIFEPYAIGKVMGGNSDGLYEYTPETLKAALTHWRDKAVLEARINEAEDAKFYHTNAKSHEYLPKRIAELRAQLAQERPNANP